MEDSRVRRRRRDDSETVGSEGEEGSISGGESHSEHESDTILDREDEDTDDYESAEENHKEQDAVKDSADNIQEGNDEELGGDSEGSQDEAEEDSEEDDDAESRKEEDLENEESKENLDADQDLKNPAYIPRRGPFYMHDVRSMETKDDGEEPKPKEKKQLWKDENRWLHDKFDEFEQAPKPRTEMINVYGYDVRSSSELPTSGFSNQRRNPSRGRRGGDREQWGGDRGPREGGRGPREGDRGPRGGDRGPRGADRGPRGDRGRQRYNQQDRFERRDDQTERTSPPQYERNTRSRQQPVYENKRQETTEESISHNDSPEMNNGEDKSPSYTRSDHPWSGRSRGGRRGRGRGRGQGRDNSGQNTDENAAIPHKTEWINSNSNRQDRQHDYNKDGMNTRGKDNERGQRQPVTEDFPPLGAEPRKQESRQPKSYQRDRRQPAQQEQTGNGGGSWAGVVTRQIKSEPIEAKTGWSDGGSHPGASVKQESSKPQRETRSYQRDRRQRIKQEPESQEEEWSGDVTVKMSKMNVDEGKQDGSRPNEGQRTKAEGLLPTPEPTGQVESPQDGGDRIYSDKREPLRPKRYSSQRQRQAADPTPITQPQPVLKTPQFYQTGQKGPPPGYQRQGNTPPVTSSPQHTIVNTAPPVRGGATPPGMGVVVQPSSQGLPGVLPGAVMQQGIILQGDVTIHPRMQHPSPTHMANPSIIHPHRPPPPLQQGVFPPPPSHFVVNYGGPPGQQYQLNSPVPMQSFPQGTVPVSIPNMPPRPQPHPIPPHTLPQPTQPLPIQVQPIINQQTPPVQPLPQGVQPLPQGVQPLPPGGSGVQTFGGVTYYSPEQQQLSGKRVQPKRTANPIRIEEPPERHSEQSQEFQEDLAQQQLYMQHQQQLQQQQQQQQLQQQQQQPAFEGGTT